MAFKFLRIHINKLKACLFFTSLYILLRIAYVYFENVDFNLDDYNAIGLLNSKKITSLIVGSSLANDIIPSTISADSYLVSRSNADIEDTFRIAKKVLKTKPVENLFVPIDIFFFQRYRIKAYHEKVPEFKDLYPQSELVEVIKYFNEPFVFDWNNLNIVLKKRMGLYEARYKKNGRVEYRTKRSKAWPNARLQVKLHLKLISEQFDSQGIVIQKWCRFLSMLDKNNINLILFSPPTLKAYRDGVENKIDKKWRKKMIELAISHGAVYRDFSNLFDSAENLELFYDATHLNEEGARSFSEIVKKLPRELPEA